MKKLFSQRKKEGSDEKSGCIVCPLELGHKMTEGNRWGRGRMLLPASNFADLPGKERQGENENCKKEREKFEKEEKSMLISRGLFI